MEKEKKIKEENKLSDEKTQNVTGGYLPPKTCPKCEQKIGSAQYMSGHCPYCDYDWN